MKTISLLSQKGGVGKSTLAICLAVEAERKGLQTLVLDTDPQCTVSKWAKRRDKDEPFVLDIKAENVADVVAEAEDKGVDFCIIDTAGRTDSSVIKCARVSDLVLIPTRPNAPDIEAIENTIDIALLAKVSALVVVNAIHHNSPRKFEDVRAFITSTYDADVFPYQVSQRAIFADALIDGSSPQEYEQTLDDERAKASREIKFLYTYLAERLDLSVVA